MESITNFEILSLVQESVSGSVYRARESRLQKIFALKVYRLELFGGDAAFEKLEQQFSSASTLDHPHLIAIYQLSRTETQTPYLVMDYVEGLNLARIIERDKHLDAKRTAHVFAQCAEALEYAHERGITHGNLKPGNVLFSASTAGGEFVKIADCGIGGPASVDSLLYMSPEACRGQMPDQRSDIYSLGCLIYDALAGQPPFASGTADQIKTRHSLESPPPLKLQDQNIGVPYLEKIVFRCLAKIPEMRYQTMSALRADLERVRDLAQPPPSSARPCPKCRAALIFSEDPLTLPPIDQKDSVFSSPQSGQSIRVFSCGRYETKHANESNWTTHHACKPMKCSCGKVANVELEERAIVMSCEQGHVRVIVGKFNLPDF